jgi:hypothetical protein
VNRPRIQRIAVLLTGLACVAARAAAAPPAAEILRKAEKIRCPVLDYVVDFRLDVTDPTSSWKSRWAEYTLIAHGKDDSLVLMREPAGFYPGTLLISHGSYWLLLPRSEKPLELSPLHVLGGDIAHGDLARGNLVAYYDVRYDGEEPVRGEPCFRLELTRSSKLGLHPRIVYWISRRTYRPIKLDYFGETGTRLKTAWYDDYRDGPLGVRSMRVQVESGLQTSERSVLTFSKLRKLELRAGAFDRRTLTALRDAALAAQTVHGRQADTDELLRALAAPAAP